MPYEKLTIEVKKELLKKIGGKLLSLWLNEKKADRIKIIGQRKKYKIAQLAQENKYTGYNAETVIIEGVRVLKNESYKCRLSDYEINEIEGEAKKEDIKRFTQNHWAPGKPLYQTFSTQIDRFLDQKITTTFFHRYKWLQAEASQNAYISSSSVSYRFLYQVLEHSLQYFLQRPNSWDTLSPGRVINGIQTLQWAAIDTGYLERKIEYFPFSDVRGFYFDSFCFELPSFSESCLQRNPNNIENYRLTRVDLFRFLYRNYHQAMTVDQYKSMVEIAPFHIDELPGKQAACPNTLLINMQTEENPAWIALHKAHGAWIAYAPGFLTDKLKEEVSNRNLKQTFGNIIIERVEYGQNTQLNDIATLTPESAWQAVLLARVLPWCYQQRWGATNSVELKDFRQTVPVSLMLEHVLSGCLDNINIDSHCANREKLPQAFINRHPFSQLSLTQLFNDDADAQYLLGEADILTHRISIQRLLNEFDQSQCLISNDLKTLTLLPKSITRSQLIQALYLIYRNQIVTRLELPKIQDESSLQDDDLHLLDLLDYNTNLLTVLPHCSRLDEHHKFLPRAMQCAARNRFLLAANKEVLARAAGKAIAQRKRLGMSTK